jgi:hypothetical protein
VINLNAAQRLARGTIPRLIAQHVHSAFIIEAATERYTSSLLFDFIFTVYFSVFPDCVPEFSSSSSH